MEQHRSRPRARKRRRPLSEPAARVRKRGNWNFVKLTVAICLLAAVIQYARSPDFTITRVMVKGNRTLREAELRKYTDCLVGANWAMASTGTVRRALQRFPQIERVRIFRFPFRALTFVVTERRPFANIAARQRYYLIDSHGVAFQVQDHPAARLPVAAGPFFSGVELGRPLPANRVEFIKKCQTLVQASGIGPIQKYCVDGEGSLSIYLADATLVRLGRFELAEKLTLANRTEQYLHSSGKAAAYIDLRSIEAPTWKPAGMS